VKWGLPALAALLLFYPFILTGPFYWDIGVAFLLAAISASAWNIVGGYAGQVSVGHSMFFGVGAYTPLLFYHLWGLPPVAGVPAGMLVSLVLAVAIGMPTFRLQGHYFSMATIAVAELIRIFVGTWDLVAPLFVAGIGMGKYRLLIIVICGLLTVALQLILAKTRFGSRLRAAVDDQRVARGLGINVGAVFGITFAFGSGLAGLGGALGAEILGLDPTFPLKYMIYFLIVVTVGGTSSITGPFFASILLGIGDVAGKYYVPKLGAFVIYAIMIIVLIWRPQGLFARGAVSR